MAKFCKLLSDKGRVNWWKLCKEYDVNPDQPKKEERGIQFQLVGESLEEIDHFMRETPNYTMESQAR